MARFVTRRLVENPEIGKKTWMAFKKNLGNGYCNQSKTGIFTINKLMNK